MKKGKKFIRLMSFCFGVLISYLLLMFITFPKLDSERIRRCKDDVYNICNEGIESVVYWFDNFEIETTSNSEKLQIINEGLQNLDYLDLVKIKVSSFYSKMIFDGTEFKCYYRYIPFEYLKIKVDKEDMNDISCYEYKKCINYKNLALGYLIYLALASVITLTCKEIFKTKVEADKLEDKKDIQENEVCKKGKKKKKNKKSLKCRK